MGRSPDRPARSQRSARSPASHTTVPSARRASMRPSRHGRPPPVAITSPDFSVSASSASVSSWRKRSSPSARKISGIERASRATIMSSVSTKQRPSRRASSRPTTDFPAPMKPTRMTLSAGILRIVSDRALVRTRAGTGEALLDHARTRSARSVHATGDESTTKRYGSRRASPVPSWGSPVHGLPGGGAAISAVAHPAAGALAEVVVDARGDPRAGKERDRLHRCHEAGRVEPDADRVPRAESEQLPLLQHVPGAVAGADPVGDLEAARDPLLAQHVVHVLGQALDGARAHAVEHDRQGQLPRLPQLGATTLERIADRAHGRRELGHGTPRALDPRDRQRDPARLDRVALAPGDGHPVDHRARLGAGPPQRERLVDERLDLGARNVDAAFVALEAQDLVGIDLEGDVGENAGRVGSGRCRHCSLRFRTTSFTDSPRTAGPQPRDGLRLARPGITDSPQTAGPQPRDVLRLARPGVTDSPPTAGPPPRALLRLPPPRA